jgi:hypothetical protein
MRQRHVRQRYPPLVRGEPLIEGLDRRIERSCDVDIPRGDDLLLEVTIDLEHVSQFVGAGEAEGTVDVRLDGVVLDGDVEALRQLLAHFVEGQVFAHDAHGLVEVPLPGLEDAVGDLPDILNGHAGEPAHRERPRIHPVISLLGTHAERIQVVPVK